MIVEKLEDTLNGGYNGLYGEVVDIDCYRLRQLKFWPLVIFDLGANVGVFTRYARSLFPSSEIICVEPDDENFYHLKKFTNHDNIVFVKKAIATDDVFRVVGAENGAHETYSSYWLRGEVVNSDVDSVMPDELINQYLKPGMPSVLKLDIEGAEIEIWNHPPSLKAMKHIDYICGEIHWTMINGEANQLNSREKSINALNTFKGTHHIEINHTSFWLTKK